MPRKKNSHTRQPGAQNPEGRDRGMEGGGGGRVRGGRDGIHGQGMQGGREGGREGGTRTATRALPHRPGFEAVVNNVLQVLAHPHLPHQPVLVAIHAWGGRERGREGGGRAWGLGRGEVWGSE